MDREEQVLVRGCADYIGQDEENRGYHGGIPEVVRDSDLQRNHSKDNPFCEGFMAHELGDLYARRSSEAAMVSDLCATDRLQDISS